jgi:hypothetical protein
LELFAVDLDLVAGRGSRDRELHEPIAVARDERDQLVRS